MLFIMLEAGSSLQQSFITWDRSTMVKYVLSTIATLLCLSSLSDAVAEWETDERCRNRGDRRVAEIVMAPNANTQVEEALISTRRTRKLRQEQTPLTFQIKMEWQEGYCWQDEWIERRYCWKCKGNVCNVGDKVEIMECDETSSIQKWIYYPESNKQGRIGPDSDQNLCFEQHDYKRWTLQWCDANNTNQLVNGWKRNKRFELFPNGQRERCFSQHHDPKNGEVVYAEICDTAREDFTSFWEVYNPHGNHLPDAVVWSPPSPCVRSLGMFGHQTIVPGQSIISPDDDTLSMKQWSNGTLALLEDGAMIWNSSEFYNEPTGDCYTVLQGNGNLVTWSNEVTGRQLVWKSDIGGPPSMSYFLGIHCSYQYIGVHEGTPNNPGKILWSGETTRLS